MESEGKDEGQGRDGLTEEAEIYQSLRKMRGKSWKSIGEMVEGLMKTYRVDRVDSRYITVSKPGGGSVIYKLRHGHLKDGLVIFTSIVVLDILNRGLSGIDDMDDTDLDADDADFDADSSGGDGDSSGGGDSGGDGGD